MPDEILTARRHHPRLSLCVVNRCTACQMLLESHESEIPTNTHGTWAKLVPVILDYRRMLQGQPRLTALCSYLDINPSRRSAKFRTWSQQACWSAHPPPIDRLL